jgi:hypothetical protein
MARYKATLISLLCTKPEEDEFWSDGDELRLVVLVDGVEQHSQSQNGVGAGTLIPIGRTFDFDSSLQVRVTDIDGPIDPDDQLGTVTVPASLTPAGSQRFTGHGADYLLSYSVIGIPVDLPPVNVPPVDVPPVGADILALARAEAARLIAEARAHRDAAEAAQAETERLLATARGVQGAGGADMSGVVGALGGLVGVGGGIIGALGALNASLSSISGALQAQPTAVPQVPAQSVGTPIV